MTNAYRYQRTNNAPSAKNKIMDNKMQCIIKHDNFDSTVCLLITLCWCHMNTSLFLFCLKLYLPLLLYHSLYLKNYICLKCSHHSCYIQACIDKKSMITSVLSRSYLLNSNMAKTSHHCVAILKRTIIT